MTEISNIFTSWRKLKKMQGVTLSDAMDEINAKHGTALPLSRFEEWVRGDRFPSAPIFRTIYAEVVPEVLKANGLSTREVDKTFIAISLPDKPKPKPKS